MNRSIEELLLCPYLIIDVLPRQVKYGSPGQYFAVEKYSLSEPQISRIKRKHIDLVLKLNCYMSIALGEYGEPDPPPELTAESMRRERQCILLDGAMIVSEPDETYLTLYNADEELAELVKILAAGEGLYVWEP